MQKRSLIEGKTAPDNVTFSRLLYPFLDTNVPIAAILQNFCAPGR
jgi:hypothetical protein